MPAVSFISMLSSFVASRWYCDWVAMASTEEFVQSVEGAGRGGQEKERRERSENDRRGGRARRREGRGGEERGETWHSRSV